MTSLPEVPGARALYLYQEETTDDERHTFSFYVRLKVLTEGGKEFANVELPYVSGASGATVDNVAGRTIQPDGSIVPFTGKPYQKLIEKAAGYKVKAVVFTLPAVQVGSVIEYRYKLHMDENWFRAPEWVVQSELFLRKAHYEWRPTSKLLSSPDGKSSQSVAWSPILPPGAEVKQSVPLRTSSQSQTEGNSLLTLDVANVPPLPQEEFMPPMQTASYRVLFYYTYVRSAEEYWKSEGKTWSREQEKFIGASGPVAAAVNQIVSPGDTPEQKLHKLYAAVMEYENTDFTRQRSTEEEKGAGLKVVHDAADVIARKRGSGDQLAVTFVAMARAAGLKAYVAAVADRSKRLFLKTYLSLNQLDDEIAVVQLDGKDVFFDPGQRYCAYGHLAWFHTLTGGLRQVDGGAVLTATRSEPYSTSHVARIADLTLDDEGVASGKITFSFTGDPALGWRHRALRSDETGIRNELRVNLERMLPGGTEVKVISVENLDDGEKPLKVAYTIKGPVGTSTGKRLVLPADLFEATTKPHFPQPKRTLMVDMRYGSQYQDAVRYTLPASLVVESVPAATTAELPKMAVYDTESKRAAATATVHPSVTLTRNLTFGAVYIKPELYPDLRAFYSKVEAADQDSLVLGRPKSDATGGNQ